MSEYIPKWVTEKLKDQEEKIQRLEEYLSNAVSPLYICRLCGAAERSLRKITYCYKCNSLEILKISDLNLDKVKNLSTQNTKTSFKKV